MARHLRGVPPALAVLVLLFVGQPSRSADPATPQSRLKAQLAAGDYSWALALARKAPTQEQHDALLARIAELQDRSGQAEAADKTAREIYDARARARALTRLSSKRLGAHGGANEPDFDSLIDLITSTVKPTSWDAVGGPGSIKGFPTGILADAQAALARPMVQDGGELAALYRGAAPKADSRSAREVSALRKVSLSRLEKQVGRLLAAGRQPDDCMQALAGLQRVQYVLVYPESGDLVLAGPAGDWKTGAQGQPVAVDTGEPVLRLDDLVVLLRHSMAARPMRFGCAITPRQEGLAAVQAFLGATSGRALRPEQRGAWLAQLRAHLGHQNVEVYGIDPRTRTATVLVEADYHMKLVGMGLAEGVPGVPSYLELIKVPSGQSPPPLDVLRWWFVMDYEPIGTTGDDRAFVLRGRGVRVLSENEFLGANGQRIHTGQSSIWNSQFAANFTEHFDELAHRYPCYVALRNIFDLALAAALVRELELDAKAGWTPGIFASAGPYEVERVEPMATVESVVNHRVINRVHVVAGVSGGVRADPAALVSAGALQKQPRAAAPPIPQLPADVWWWD